MADTNQENSDKKQVTAAPGRQPSDGTGSASSIYLNQFLHSSPFGGKSAGNFFHSFISGFSSLQKIIIVLIFIVATLLIFALFMFSGKAQIPMQPSDLSAGESTIPDFQTQADANSQQLRQLTESTPAFAQPLSLKLARSLFEQKEYEHAFDTYQRLSQNLLPADKSLKDYFYLQMALCKKNAGDIDSSIALIKSVLNSTSPLVRSLSNYLYAVIEMESGRFLHARTRAFQALALISAVDLDDNLSSSISRNCYYLANQAMTQHILSLSAADNQMPQLLYGQLNEFDTLNKLSDSQLNLLVNSGSELLSYGLLSPQFKKIQQLSDAPQRWSVCCQGASIEELMAKFASLNSFELVWKFPGREDSNAVIAAARKRAVHLYIPSETPEQLFNIAAGCAGLAACVDANNLVTVTKPDEYFSLTEHIALLVKHNISLWQHFLLRFPQDDRTADAHFALGLLKERSGSFTDSIAEYKIVSNQYSQNPLAPFALLNSAAVKSNLYDYLGARDDLMQLNEQYPDVPIAEQALYNLATATMNASIFDQAQQLYQKSFYLTSSAKLKADSAFGAAKCSWQLNNLEDTVRWTTEFIKLAGNENDGRLSYAYFLLGKASFALGKTEQAFTAFHFALDADLAPEDYINILSTLVNTYIQKESFLEAMAVIENAQNRRLPQRENIQLLLLKCKLSRKMGFADKALASLDQMDEYIDQPQLKAACLHESALCLIELGRLELARRNLTDFLVIAQKDDLYSQACLKLADVCLQLGKNDNAISVCTQILDSKPDSLLREKALVLMSYAYKQKKNYDKAAMALAEISGEFHK